MDRLGRRNMVPHWIRGGIKAGRQRTAMLGIGGKEWIGPGWTTDGDLWGSIWIDGDTFTRYSRTKREWRGTERRFWYFNQSLRFWILNIRFITGDTTYLVELLCKSPQLLTPDRPSLINLNLSSVLPLSALGFMEMDSDKQDHSDLNELENQAKVDRAHRTGRSSAVSRVQAVYGAMFFWDFVFLSYYSRGSLLLGGTT
jgi:hypothetical protein